MSLFRWLRVPMTRRSTATPTRLRVVSAAGKPHVCHVLRVPRGACPVSRNPLGGEATIAYGSVGQSLEVVSLHDALRWACSGAPGAPRSVEDLAAWLAKEAHGALGVPVDVTLDLLIRPGRQRLIVRVAP